MRTRAAGALFLMSATLVAGAPSVEPVRATVEVVTRHHEVPDGVLPAQLSLSGGCPSGELVRLACADGEATGTVTAARLGFSAAHRHGLTGPEGTVRDVIEVEVSSPGDLTVSFELPDGFASEVTAAPGSSEFTSKRAVWRRPAQPAGTARFEVVLSGPGSGDSELGDVTIELMRAAAPLVVSAFGAVDSPEGEAITRLRMVADRDVGGVAPTFTDPETEIQQVVYGRMLTGVRNFWAESNGNYSGTVEGHVENVFYDARAETARDKEYGLNSGAAVTTWYDFGRIRSRIDGFTHVWGTSEMVPFDHHDVVSPASLRISLHRADHEQFLEDGPQSVNGSGGSIELTQYGVTTWATGLTSQSLALQQNDPVEPPSAAGEALALIGVVLDAHAVGDDVDNSDGTEGLAGYALVLDAPEGWTIDSLSYSPTARLDLDVAFDRQDGSRVVLTPILAPGTVFPVTWEGAPYRNTLDVIARMAPTELRVNGIPLPQPQQRLVVAPIGDVTRVVTVTR